MPPALGQFRTEVVYEFMQDRELNVNETAKLIGIASSTLKKHLSGKTVPMLSTSRLIAEAMDIPVGDLWER